MIFLIFLFFFNSNAIDLKNYRQNDIEALNEFNLVNSKFYTIKEVQPKAYEKYLKDIDNRVNDDFYIDPYIQDRVSFWFSIYTQYTSNDSLFHDKKNLAIVYDSLNFSSLDKNTENDHLKFSLQHKLVAKRVEAFRKTLKRLGTDDLKDAVSLSIFKALKRANINIPHDKTERINFFSELSNNLRAQTGQKDKILAGLEKLEVYHHTIKKYFNVFEMPIELLAISFLESSFNVYARSKVNAVGAWQFMPRIGKHFMRTDSYRDHRKSALISTISALHLLAQNRKILKRWDLAVSAYNNGTGLLLKAIRKLRNRGIDNPSLIDVIRHFKNDSFGFASRNFYSSFLALVYALAYKDQIYDTKLKVNNFIDLYLAKCRVSPNYFFKQLEKNSPNIRYMNSHFQKRYNHLPYKTGTVFASDQELSDEKYLKISIEQMKKNFPINWHKRFLKGHSCSTR